MKMGFGVQAILRILPVLIVAECLSGCVAHRIGSLPTILADAGRGSGNFVRARQTLANMFPSRYRATQRAIISVGGKQFTCDGVLTAAPDKGRELAIVSNLGAVTGLRVRPDGECELLKITPLFPAEWSRRFVAEDLRCLFVPPRNLEPAGRLADGRLVLRTKLDAERAEAWYVFAASGERWQELDLMQDNRCRYRAVIRRYGAFAGIPGEVPCEFEVDAGSHRLDLRITGLTVPTDTAP